MNKVLITGVTGLVGDGVSRYLLRNNWDVYGTSRRFTKSNRPNFHPLNLNLEREEQFINLNRNVPFRAVIHNAAKVPYGPVTDEEAETYYRCNVDGTRHLLNWAEKSGTKIVIYISSTGAINDNIIPLTEEAFLKQNANHYHTSKIMGELLCQMYQDRGKLRVVIMRISAPYGYTGSRLSVLPKFIDKVLSNQNIDLWGNGTRKQVFTFVEDIGYACELAIKNDNCNGVYNITGSESITMQGLAETILCACPKSNSKIVLSGHKDPKERQPKIISIVKAKEEIGFEPKYNLYFGIRKILSDKDKSFWSQ